jgi:hypothetical protein
VNRLRQLFIHDSAQIINGDEFCARHRANVGGNLFLICKHHPQGTPANTSKRKCELALRRELDRSKGSLGFNHAHAHACRAKRAILRAFSVLQSDLNRHAGLFAYVDDFRYPAPLCVVRIPMAFLLKSRLREQM